VDAGGGRIEGSTTDYATVADVAVDNSNWQYEGEQRRIGQFFKVAIRKREDYTPQIGDTILWRDNTLTITGIQLVIKQRQWWEMKTTAVYGQN